MTVKYSGVYLGTITAVYPPNHKLNASKYQYEYCVNVTVEGYAQIPVNNCLQMDSDGNIDNFEHHLLLPKSSVLVMFPNGTPTYGVIIGAVRNFKTKMNEILGTKQYWHKRYNKFELSIDQNGHFLAKSDSGPYATVTTTKVTLDDSEGENLTLDKTTHTTTLNTKDLVQNIKQNSTTTIDKDMTLEVKGNVTIHVVGNVSMVVDGNVDLQCKQLTAKVQENANVECKELSAKASGNATVETGADVMVKAGGNAQVDASMIKLNGGAGDILTTATTPLVDNITGVPCVGVPTVKSG